MRLHRHSKGKFIMGGVICLLLALTGGVATASVATAPPTGTVSAETRDTAEIAESSIIATIDVAMSTNSVGTASLTTSSKKTTSEHKDVATSSKSADSKKTSTELEDVLTSSSSNANQETSTVYITYQTIEENPETYYESDYESSFESTASQPIANQEMTSEPSKNEDTTSAVTSTVTTESSWDGPVLNSFAGIIQGPSGTETYYNLDMSGVVSIMHSLGYNYEYWIREDGVKMFGSYVMCAADLSIRPKGTIIETSLGTGIVCDTGEFVSIDPYRLDIAVNW